MKPLKLIILTVLFIGHLSYGQQNDNNVKFYSEKITSEINSRQEKLTKLLDRLREIETDTTNNDSISIHDIDIDGIISGYSVISKHNLNLTKSYAEVLKFYNDTIADLKYEINELKILVKASKDTANLKVVTNTLKEFNILRQENKYLTNQIQQYTDTAKLYGTLQTNYKFTRDSLIDLRQTFKEQKEYFDWFKELGKNTSYGLSLVVNQYVSDFSTYYIDNRDSTIYQTIDEKPFAPLITAVFNIHINERFRANLNIPFAQLGSIENFKGLFNASIPFGFGSSYVISKNSYPKLSVGIMANFIPVKEARYKPGNSVDLPANKDIFEISTLDLNAVPNKISYKIGIGFSIIVEFSKNKIND